MSATMIVGGERRAAVSGAVDEITSPWDGRVVGTVPRAGPADADAAAWLIVRRQTGPRPAGHRPHDQPG